MDEPELITGNYRAVQRFYADDGLWSTVDTWHSYVDQSIGALLQTVYARISPAPRRIANIGSGGHTYGIGPDLQVHVDVLRQRLAGTLGILATAEQLPLRGAVVDLALCVGSVINHGDPHAMINEIARILRPGGLAIIEWDSLDGLHRKPGPPSHDARLVNTFFNGRMFILAEYSKTYVESLLSLAGLDVVHVYSFHIASGLPLRLGISPSLAAHLIRLDPLLRLVPSLRHRGCNLVLIARRAPQLSV